MADITLQSDSVSATVLDRVEATLRVIRVLKSAGLSNVSGDDLELVLTGKRRAIEQLEEIVENCIAILDELRGDPDLEDGNDTEGQTWNHDGCPDDVFVGKRPKLLN